MKKIYIPIISVFAIIALALIGLMIVIINRGFISGDWSSDSIFGGNLKEVSDKTYNSDGIENIDVDLSSDTVKIFVNDSEEIRIVQYMSRTPKEDDLAIADKSNDTFKLYKNYDHHININFNSRVEVYLPKSFKNNLKVGTSSGSIALENDLALKNCDLEASSGSIRLNSLNADEVKINTTSGSIHSEKTIDTESVDFEASSGSININDVNTQKINAETTSGSIRINKVKGIQTVTSSSGSININEADGTQDVSSSSGSINIDGASSGGSYQSTSGSIRINFSEVTDNITCEASSGSVRIDIPNDDSFNFKGKSSSGSIHTFFENFTSSSDKKDKTAKVGDNPKFDVNVSTTSGSISVD